MEKNVNKDRRDISLYNIGISRPVQSRTVGNFWYSYNSKQLS